VPSSKGPLTLLVPSLLLLALQLRWLFWRCLANVTRQPVLMRTQLAVHLCIAAVVGALFFGVEADVAGFQNRAGAIHFLLAFFSLGSLSTSGAVTREWGLVYSEVHGRLYGPVPYVLASLGVELLVLRTLPAVVLCAAFYGLMGLRPVLSKLLTFSIAAVLANADASLLCNAIASCAPTTPSATTLISAVLLLLSLLLAGFELNLSALPETVAWLPQLSFCRYAFEVMLGAELEGTVITVEAPGVPPVKVKASLLLELLGLDPDRVALDLGVLCAIGVGWLALTVIAVSIHLRPPARYDAGPLSPKPTLNA